MTEGLIIKINSTIYTVKSNNNTFNCVLRGKFRHNSITPCVGDKVKFNESELVINEILPRINSLDRPPVANVDAALIITSVKEPNINMTLLDKLISTITINEITPILVFTKMDLLNRDEKKNITNIIKYYKKIGYDVVTNNKINKLKKILKNKLVVLCGQTGAGKSTLINKIDKKLDLKTGEISQALGRGKHTTRMVELYDMKTFYVMDTPGFSSLDFNNVNINDIKDSFIEFKSLNCKFKDCKHINENDCEIIKNVENNNIMKSRYDSYKRFVGEVK